MRRRIVLVEAAALRKTFGIWREPFCSSSTARLFKVLQSSLLILRWKLCTLPKTDKSLLLHSSFCRICSTRPSIRFSSYMFCATLELLNSFACFSSFRSRSHFLLASAASAGSAVGFANWREASSSSFSLSATSRSERCWYCSLSIKKKSWETTGWELTWTSNFFRKRLNFVVHSSYHVLKLFLATLLARHWQIQTSSQLHYVPHWSLKLRVYWWDICWRAQRWR